MIMVGKRRKLDKNKRVKAIARKRVGSPRPGRTLDEKAVRQKPKHKVDWTEFDSEPDRS